MSSATKKGLELALGLVADYGPVTESFIETCSKICRLATTHGHIQETRCNRELSPTEEARELHVERRIVALIKQIDPKIVVTFQGDPRGSTVKLKLPSGRYDCWDGEHWCVPQ